MATYLFKTEPSEFSFADLQAAKAPSVWDGVSNAAAIGFLRRVKVGDEVLIYHTGDEKAVVGLAAVTGGPREDPKRPGLTAKGETKFVVVELKALKPAASPMTLATIKQDKRLANLPLLKQSRLSVMEIEPAAAKIIKQACGFLKA
ncbi:MAG: EVE domain-containing protein [Phycisphaerales bacterium]|nr:EVE domain-containing protein [Phycisphaerales bacterium]